MNILVTGCAGFIGGNFVKQFVKEFPKIKVIGIDDFSTGRRDALSPMSAFYEGSITDGQLLDKIFANHRPKYVFHFAAIPRVAFSVEKPAVTTHVNVYGTALLLEKASKYKVKRFIFSSSSSIYGQNCSLPTKEDDPALEPISPYALQKYMGELLCRNFGQLYKLETVCLRYFNVFGPGQYGDSAYATVISAWLESLYYNNNSPYIEGDGSQSRDFCYVDNVVQSNILSMKSNHKFFGDAFNIACGERFNLLEIKKMIKDFSGKSLNLDERPTRLGDVPHTHADISKARLILNYEPKIKLKEGLQKTIEWFKQR